MSGRERNEVRSIGEQAAEWLLVLEEQGVEAQAAFTDWLSKSPLNVEAFLKASAMDTLLTRVDPDRSYEVKRCGGAAVLDIGPTDDPVSVTKRAGQFANATARSRARTPWLIAACLATAVIAGLGIWKVSSFGARGGDFRTDVGEQRVLELEDGSVLYLNARSEVRVAFTERERRIDLLSGEALFRVHQDRLRPFRVHGKASIVEAVGTQFNVRLRQEDALVSVIEGAVRVSTSASALQAQRPVQLEAGLQVLVDWSGQIDKPARADLKRVEAWRQRRLIFVDAPLADIANEFNRYNRAPRIVVEGEVAGARRYAAAFDADDPESLLEILTYDPVLRVERSEGEILIKAR